MRQTPAQQLLDGWEAVRDQPMPVRAAALAAVATSRPLREVMRWSIARRDLALFALRAQVFGERIDAVIDCPGCAEPLEMPIALPAIAPNRSAAGRSDTRWVRVEGRRVRCRLPTSDDLLAVSTTTDVAEARQALIARCIDTDDPSRREHALALLADEPTDVELRLTCPACGHDWQVPFDIATFVWHEVEEWARRTLHEIHVIAGAFGWSEDDILRLSARRRQTYVEMI